MQTGSCDMILVFAQNNVFCEDQAGVAQLVERNLAKVEVASSSLVSRSKFGKKSLTQFNCVRLFSLLHRSVKLGTGFFDDIRPELNLAINKLPKLCTRQIRELSAICCPNLHNCVVF